MSLKSPNLSSWSKSAQAPLLIGVAAWVLSISSIQAAVVAPDTGHYQAAVSDLKQGQVEKALPEINLAATAAPTDGNIQILKALILSENDHFADSQAIIKPFLTKGAYVVRARSVEAEILLRHKDFTRSAQYYTAVLPQANSPIDIARVHLRLLYCCVGQSDWLGASKLLALLNPSDPHFPGFYFGQAAISTGLNDSAKAAKQLQTARTLYGNAVVNDELELFLKVFDSAKPNSEHMASPSAKASPTPAPGASVQKN